MKPEVLDNVNMLLQLHERRHEECLKLFELCLRELRKSKLFIQMSKEERAYRRELITSLEELTGVNK